MPGPAAAVSVGTTTEIFLALTIAVLVAAMNELAATVV